MSRLKHIYWKDLPPEETQILNPRPRHVHAGGTSLRPFVEGTLENGEFVSFELPIDSDSDADADSGSNFSKEESEKLHLFSDNGRTNPEEWQEPKRAMKTGTLAIRELSSRPRVHYIEVRNSGKLPVFFPAGLAFEGGAQNRMILDCHILRNGEHNLPVYCIEAGRWGDPAGVPFQNLRRLPDLMMLHFLNKSWGNSTDFAKSQIAFWELALEALVLSNAENPSMNLLYNPEEKGAQKSASQNGDLAKKTKESLLKKIPKKSRGFFAHDPKSALSVLRIRPGIEHLKENISNYIEELRWRRRLRRHAAGARRYFRIFDAEKKIAIQCDPTGKPYKTLRKKPVLFPYTESDLENSFVPPIDPPPDPPEIRFSKTSPHRRSVRECLELLKDCEASIKKTGKDIYRMHFSHPRLYLQGTALLAQGRLADLDMILFEGDAKAL